jgi:hypothetical protein
MLKLLPFYAPQEYVFSDPDTNHTFIANTQKELVTNIINYRAQNNLEPIQHLNLVLENYWCGLPENAGKCTKTELKRGWFLYWKGGVQVFKNVFYGEKNMVSQEVADARSVICSTCPENIFPDKDGFIEYSDRLAEASTGGKKTVKYSELGNCNLCTCTLKALVWSKNNKVSPEENYPAHCWKLLKELNE